MDQVKVGRLEWPIALEKEWHKVMEWDYPYTRRSRFGVEGGKNVLDDLKKLVWQLGNMA
jgi:hypothetical protein